MGTKKGKKCHKEGGWEILTEQAIKERANKKAQKNTDEREWTREWKWVKKGERINQAKWCLMMQSQQCDFIGSELHSVLTLNELCNGNGELWVGRDWLRIAHRPVLWFRRSNWNRNKEAAACTPFILYSLLVGLLTFHTHYVSRWALPWKSEVVSWKYQDRTSAELTDILNVVFVLFLTLKMPRQFLQIGHNNLLTDSYLISI